jgi:glycosyltransferase involved in cell wall biosynthesis
MGRDVRSALDHRRPLDQQSVSVGVSVIDGHSTDATPAAVARHDESRVISIGLPVNGGPSLVRNATCEMGADRLGRWGENV